MIEFDENALAGVDCGKSTQSQLLEYVDGSGYTSKEMFEARSSREKADDRTRVLRNCIGRLQPIDAAGPGSTQTLTQFIVEPVFARNAA